MTTLWYCVLLYLVSRFVPRILEQLLTAWRVWGRGDNSGDDEDNDDNTFMDGSDF